MGLRCQQKSHVCVTQVGLGTNVIFRNAKRDVPRRMDIAPSPGNVCASLAGLVMIALTVSPTQGVTLSMVAVRSLGSANVAKDGLEHFAMEHVLESKQLNREPVGIVYLYLIWNTLLTIGY